MGTIYLRISWCVVSMFDAVCDLRWMTPTHMRLCWRTRNECGCRIRILCLFWFFWSWNMVTTRAATWIMNSSKLFVWRMSQAQQGQKLVDLEAMLAIECIPLCCMLQHLHSHDHWWESGHLVLCGIIVFPEHCMLTWFCFYTINTPGKEWAWYYKSY